VQAKRNRVLCGDLKSFVKYPKPADLSLSRLIL